MCGIAPGFFVIAPKVLPSRTAAGNDPATLLWARHILLIEFGLMVGQIHLFALDD
jgi:hypothetical protein